MHTSTATKRSIRSTIAALLAVLTMLAMVVPAAAAAKDVYSSETTKTVNHRTYRFYAHARFDGSSLVYGGVCFFPSRVITAGNLKGQINLYRANGTLVEATDWLTTTTDTGTGGVEFTTFDTAQVGSYYCNGKVKIIDGSSTYAYDTTTTTTLRISRSDFERCPVEVNSNGEVYGSEVFLKAQGISADLILAENSDGLTGYVKAVDLYDESDLSTNMGNIGSGGRMIPMYESDGETIIGYFEMATAAITTPAA